MKPLALLVASLTITLPVLAGPKKVRFDKLPPCVRECFDQHRGGGEHPFKRPNLPWQAWEWCQQTGILRNDWWRSFGKSVDECKIETCPWVDEWYDAAQWQWDTCGDHYKTGDSLSFLNGWRKSTWWPNMAGVPRPEKGEGWIEGVWESQNMTGLIGVIDAEYATEDNTSDPI